MRDSKITQCLKDLFHTLKHIGAKDVSYIFSWIIDYSKCFKYFIQKTKTETERILFRQPKLYKKNTPKGQK